MDLSKYPVKIRILMSLKEDGEQWATELTDKVITATGKKPSKLSRRSIKSFLVELDMKGNVKPVDARPVDPSFYGTENSVESKYAITEQGIERLKKVI